MGEFEEAALRLKQELKVSLDQEVAAALGLSSRAWAGRKKQGSFPERAVIELATQRPGIDVAYVLTGHRTTGGARAHIDRTVDWTPGGDEQLAGLAADAIKRMARLQGDRAPIYANLLESLNYCSEEQLDLLRLLVDQLAIAARAPGTRDLQGAGRAGATQTFHGGVGSAVAGNVKNLTSSVVSRSKRKP